MLKLRTVCNRGEFLIKLIAADFNALLIEDLSTGHYHLIINLAEFQFAYLSPNVYNMELASWFVADVEGIASCKKPPILRQVIER